MNDLSWTMVSFVVIALLVFAFFSWLFRGFMMPYLKVKASRGSKVLVKVRNPLVDYYSIGVPDGKVVRISLKTGKEKKDVSISIPSTAFYRSLGVICVDMDEESCAVITRDYNVISTHDAVTTNNLMVRQKMAPNDTRNKDIWVMVLLVLILVGVVVLGFMLNGLSEQIGSNVVGQIVGGVNL